MENQSPLMTSTPLTDQPPTVDSQVEVIPKKRKNGLFIFVSAGTLLLVSLASVGVIVYQTQQQASIADTRSMAAVGDETDTETQQCQDIKLYKNNQVVAVTSLLAGDTVQIGIASQSATKARFRINQQTPVEVTQASPSGEFKYTYTFPTTMTNVIIRAERFLYGAWQ
jgi:hypothetical protein